MNRALSRLAPVVALTLLFGCKAAEEPGPTDPVRGTGGSAASGGRSGTGGTSTGGSSGASGGVSGSGGASTGGSSGTGGASASGGTGGSIPGTGGSTSATGGTSAPDAAADVPAAETGGSDRPGILGEGADYPGRPEVRICPKDWTHEQCCEFLCRCLNEICTDSPKGKPGIASCKTWCPKLSNMAMRCHVYHCFESVSMGGKKDHDSHCGHAADQVAGGMCRADVYN